MGKEEKYQELIFQLGDLARDRLAKKPNSPRSMQRVFKTEEAVLQRRDDLAALEHQMNEEDQAYRAFLAHAAREKKSQGELVARFRRAVDAVEGTVKGLRRSVGNARSELGFAQGAVHSLESTIRQAEEGGGDPAKLERVRADLKRQRIVVLRLSQTLEDYEHKLRQTLTPAPGQPGSQGILAHRRILELEDEEERRKVEFDQRMADLDAQVVQKEEAIQGAEDFLDQALFLLGEECYQLRIPDPELSVFYPRLDKLR
jgi:hypothetical protein